MDPICAIRCISCSPFVFQANPPDVSRLPTEDVVGVTVVFLSCSYNGEEFIRVGYYVNNEYEDEEMRETPPTTPQIDKLVRNILANKPRVTKWSINFDSNQTNGVAVQELNGNTGISDMAAQMLQEQQGAMMVD